MRGVPARALFHTAPRCVEIRELPTPQPSAGEVVVSTLFSGISGGTERLVYRGEVAEGLALDDTIDALGGAFRYPFRYGYACVGEVSDSGRRVFAFQPHQDVFAARASDLIPLPAIDPAPATLFPLVETALQVTLDAEAGYRDRVIVLGAGVLGLLTALLLQRSGRQPLCAEPQPWRRELAGAPRRHRRTSRGTGQPGGSAGHRRQRQPGRAGHGAEHAGPRGHLARRVLVRHQASHAAARRRLSPPPPDHPQYPGIDDPGPAVGAVDAVSPPLGRR